jgi:hypothetical protein
MRAWCFGLLGAVATLASGCGPSCQSTCHRIHSPNECQIATPGQDWTDGYRECVDMCEAALQQPGPLGSYNPDEPPPAGTTAHLKNERQAALWMQCVDETACELINAGHCAPIQ